MAPAPGSKMYYQLLVRIYQGRRFPLITEDGGKAIAFECRFNSETLSTDPVPFTPSPTFNTELVWEYGAEKHR